MEEEEEKPKFTRTPRPVYVIMTVKDDDGNILDISKENVDILSVHKNSDELLDVLDGGSLAKGTFYKRIALA